MNIILVRETSKPSRKSRRARRQQPKNTKPLKAALWDLGVMPFTRESVNNYRAAQLAKAKKEAGKPTYFNCYLRWGLMIACVAIVILLPFFIAMSPKIVLVWLLPTLVINAWHLKAGYTMRYRQRLQVYWSYTDYPNFLGTQGGVPEYVKKLVDAIKETVPTARLTVYHVGIDPLLQVTLGNESYIIAAWD